MGLGGTRKTARSRQGWNRPANRAMDILLALVILLPGSVLLALVWVLHRLTVRDGGPFFYSGERMGLHKQRFNIYKVRTLSMDAAEKSKSGPLQPGSGCELPLGGFLRTTRLDEIPQLWNLLRGEMSLIGPRPLRPVVYEQLRGTIPNLDDRFLVKPGLLGFSQIFTPHSTPQRIRAMIDNRYAREHRNLITDLFFFARTGSQILLRLGRETLISLAGFWRLPAHRRGESKRRRMRRVRGDLLRVVLHNPSFDQILHEEILVKDINYEAFSVETALELDCFDRLYVALDGPRRPHDSRRKRARCEARVVHKSRSEDGNRWRYVLSYEPVSALQRYNVDQYFLRQSIVNA